MSGVESSFSGRITAFVQVTKEKAMAQQREGALTSRIAKALMAEYGGDVWLFKVHGSAFQTAGVPDLVGVLRGSFFALEVKLPDGSYGATRIQELTMDKIRRAAGITGVVTSPAEALAILEKLAPEEHPGES